GALTQRAANVDRELCSRYHITRGNGGGILRIAVCDDSIMDQERIVKALRNYAPECQPERFSEGKKLLAAAAKVPPFDIVFLDIYMPGESGVETAEKLRKLSSFTGIVFVTTSLDHAVDAFSLNAIHYIVKPVKAEDVEEALRRLEEIRKRQSPIIVLSAGGTNYSIHLDEINYIRCEGHLKEVVLTNGKMVRVRMPLGELEEKLGSSFLKVNRSCIVNMEQIEQMGTEACILQNGVRMEFSRRERAAVKAAYSNYLFDRLGGREELEASV
ncbi:MAG: LytTR family DNA-binding domain-containing protein, partial [Clostridiales bacterium]|nr:LytTR family DNA-binding domain-containing protein [Clostridiales bacterium]